MANRSGLNFNKKRRKIEAAVIKEIFSWITGIFVAILLAFVLVYCVGMTTSVIGISMKPTLENGEKIKKTVFFSHTSGLIPVCVMGVSAVTMVICGLLMRKPKLKWLSEYALPISLVVGMAAAIPISAWLG